MRLGIDFGTSSTVAVLAVGDREPRPLLFDGSPLLPSAVGLDPTGRLIAGRDALHAATATPGAVERHPKRCIDDGSVLLGSTEIAVPALFAAVLGRVLDEAARAGGGPPDEIVLTHPAAWGKERRATLRSAAGLAEVRLVSEPVAAAHHLVDVAGERLPDGATAVVYDFGAGTFDASVVRRTGDRFDVLATQGRPDSGGLDIDAAIVAHLAGSVTDKEGWARLEDPRSSGDRRARQQLWDNVRTGKESLTRASSTLIHVPLLDLEVPLGREELDRLAAPILSRTVETTRAVLELAGVEADTIFLVGGASRMPAVPGVLHRAFGVEPVTVDQPELAVAEGSLRTAAAAAVDTDDWPAAVAVPPAAPGRPRRPRRPRVLLGAGAGVAVVAVAAAAAFANGPDDPVATPSPAASASPAPSPSPSRSYPPGVDPCLLGTWRVTSVVSSGTINGVRVQYLGSGGEISVYREDSTVTVDLDGSTPRVATYRNDRWENVQRGQATMRYAARDGEMILTLISSNAHNTLTRNGKFNAEGKTEWRLEPEKYQCTATSLIETSTQGNWSSESVRVA